MNRTDAKTARYLDLATEFASRHYGLVGSIRLHRHALGWDLVRSPANVALAPVFLVVRLAALILRFVGLKRPSIWLTNRRIYFRSNVSRVIEAALWTQIAAERSDPIHQPTARQKRLVEDYTDVRNAISEIFTSILFLSVGFFVFQSATPGVISLAPVVSDFTATSTARESFPLGQSLGSVWYSVFPVDVPLWYMISIGLALASGASIVTSFAGVIADPLQAYTGIHKRRLLRLLVAIDTERDDLPRLANEHIIARFADLSDAGVSLVRSFRP